MIKNKKILAWLALTGVIALGVSFVSAGTGCIGGGTTCSTNTSVSVTITPGDVCIGNDGNFSFGNFTVSSSSQTVSGSFASPFWVEDLKGDNAGYYTTVQMSGSLAGSGSSTIPSTSVSIRANEGITTIAWSSNVNVVVDSAVAWGYQSLNNPITLIKRTNATNYWLVGKYGTTPSLQLVIPAYQAVGSYTGTLLYTLYTN